MTVTRTELADHIEAAFATGPATRDRLLAFAAGNHARPEVIEVIKTLPERPYPAMRDMWADLGHIPIGG